MSAQVSGQESWAGLENLGGLGGFLQNAPVCRFFENLRALGALEVRHKEANRKGSKASKNLEELPLSAQSLLSLCIVAASKSRESTSGAGTVSCLSEKGNQSSRTCYIFRDGNACLVGEEALVNSPGNLDVVPRWRLQLFLAVCIGLAGGVVLDRLSTGTLDPFAASMNFGLISEAWNTIERDYVDRASVKPRTMTYGALAGMVDALGDTGHSRFLTPDMVRSVKDLRQNKFEGIGAEVRTKDGHIVIVAPIENSPAQKAGLRAGDIILKVDGKEATATDLDRVVERIKGPAGTHVTLTIMDPASGSIRDVTLTRARITVHEVAWRRLPGTSLAHIHIASFNKGVSEDLRKALRTIQHDELHGLILDLRNDPGGLLQEAVATASQFLSGGNVLLEKNAQGETKPVSVQPGGVATAIPMAVLVNAGSASASEIVAGALQDAGRATIVGEQTFGTGTVLNEFDLSDGSALLLAVQEWLTPKGNVIWHKGITPGVVVALPANVRPLFPETESELTSAELSQSKDTQLLKAVEMLSSFTSAAK